LKTDVNNPDSDGDSFKDGEEILNGFNPLGTGRLFFDTNFANSLKGKILLQVESRGEAWYVNVDDGKRYYMKDGGAAYQIMRFLSLGITDSDLVSINEGGIFIESPCLNKSVIIDLNDFFESTGDNIPFTNLEEALKEPAEVCLLSLFGEDKVSGELPADFSKLTNLIDLDITLTEDVTKVPPEIFNLPNLHALIINANLTTSIVLPNDIGKLTKLLYLDFFGPYTEIPIEIGNLTNLSYLGLVGNFGEIPSSIGNLKKLEILSLNLSFSPKLPPEIGNLSNLEHLDLSLLQEAPYIPPEIVNLKKLKLLNLYRAELTDVPMQIYNIVSLNELYLHSNRLTNITPEIGNLVNLEKLSLRANELTEIPSEIGNLTQLKKLNLEFNEITSLPSELSNLVNLEELILNLNPIYEIPQEFSKLNKLKRIEMVNNYLKHPPLTETQKDAIRVLLPNTEIIF